MIRKNMVTWMPRSSCFRTRFPSQHVKRSETLLKSSRQHFYTNFPLTSNKLSCVSCLLVRSEMLGSSFNTLTADHMYSCHNWQKFPQQIQTQISSKVKIFSGSVIAFLKSTKILSIPKNKITFIASIFPKLLIQKNVVIWLPESSCFRTRFRSQHVKRSETLLKSSRQHFYTNFPLISNKLSCVSCLLVGSEMLGSSFNTLMSDHMYSCHNWEKFPEKVPKQLSSKPKPFSATFIAFLKST